MIKKTPQHEWIDDLGMFLWLAFFFSEIGAGAYFISLFHDFRPGYVVGCIITLALGGLIHMAYLGNPQRVFGMFLKVKTSELSRGMWVILAFAGLGFFQSLAGFRYGAVLKTLMGFICLLLIMRGFATMNVMKVIPSWNQSTVLPLSIVSGIWVGSQVIQLIMGINGRGVLGMEVWCRVILSGLHRPDRPLFMGYLSCFRGCQISISSLVRGDFSKP